MQKKKDEIISQKSCKWTTELDGYSTSCYNELEKNENTDSYRFCPFCGKSIQAKKAEEKIADEDLNHDYFVRVSGLWQKMKAASFADFSSLPKFKVDVRTVPAYSLKIMRIRGENISDEDVEELLSVEIENKEPKG